MILMSLNSVFQDEYLYLFCRFLNIFFGFLFKQKGKNFK